MIRLFTELISTPEYYLLEVIQDIQFGELFGVQVDDNAKWIEYEVSPAMQCLLEYIRDGAQYIDILTVHNGQPVLAETDMKLQGFRCRKKVKFPTVHAEG